MAGETTSFFANSIFSGLNKGLQGRRALKEEERLKALKLQQAAEDRANKIADYQQEQEIAQNIKNRALADDREQMINTAALLGRETKNPGLAYYGIAKAFGLEGGLNPTEKAGANARSSRGASSIPKAIKSDDRLKKLQVLKAFIDYSNSVSETKDEFGNIIPAKLPPADLFELGLYGQRLVRDLYDPQEPDDEQSAQGSPNGTSTLSDAFAILFGTAGKPAKNSAVSNAPTVDAPVDTTEESDVTPSYTVTMGPVPEPILYDYPVTEPTLYKDAARLGEIGTGALSNAIRQGRRDLGYYYDKASAPTTPEEYSRLSALQKIIYKFTGKNISPKRLEQLLNKER
jgi:hypothetical protein